MLEKRGGRCRTDGPIRVRSCQMQHTIAAIKAAWRRSLCLGLLSACDRLRQLREIRHSLQQALNPWSRTQSAATDGSPACCTSSDITRVRHAQGTTLSIPRTFVPCAASVQTAVLVLFGLSCLEHYRPLQRRPASDKCSVRCRPIKQRQNLPQRLIKIYLR